MVLHGLCGYHGTPMWTEAQYAKRLETARFKLKGLGDIITRSINQTMELHQQVLSQLYTLQRQGKTQYWDDLHKELSAFLSPACLEQIPLEQWPHCPRLLRCYLRRIDRLNDDPEWEQELSEKYQSHQTTADKLASQWTSNDLVKRWAIQQFRWMLEEFKVSIFAQDLKTAFPVSAKRLNTFLATNLE